MKLGLVDPEITGEDEEKSTMVLQTLTQIAKFLKERL